MRKIWFWRWYVYYRHSFEVDVIFALTKRQAKKKAIKILKARYSDVARFPAKVTNGNNISYAYNYEDLIESIEFEPFTITE